VDAGDVVDVDHELSIRILVKNIDILHTVHIKTLRLQNGVGESTDAEWPG